ncbi:MAG: diacylglycerol kinase family protein [Oscillospiraceae bacterium]|jgi:diacylglycerol kinase (ATP)|nr:diacylglycerol kinase family protein [Oscillospiraceae bacterium]
MKSFLNSFLNAANGIWFCIRYERNFRIHLIASAYVLGFAPLFSLSYVEWAVLLLTIAIVLVAEAINTAVEHTVDLLSPDTHPAARIAKDTAAAAVLVCTVVSVAVGILIFGRPIMLLQVFKSIISSPLKLVLLATSLVLSIWFIIKGGYKKAS